MRTATRLWLSTAISLAALVGFCGTLIFELHGTQSADAVRIRERETIGAANGVLSQLKDLETGARGFLLTGSDRYLEPVETARLLLPQQLKNLQSMTAGGDAATKADVLQIEVLAGRERADVNRMIAARRTSKNSYAADRSLLERGKSDMDAVRLHLASIVQQAQARLNVTTVHLDAARRQVVYVAMGGSALVAFAVVAATVLSLRAFERRRARLMSALDAMGRDGEPVLIETDDPDLAGISAAFNRMSARLRSEARRREKAEEMLNLIRRLADRLPGCIDDDEFAAVIESFAPQLSGERAGTLYLLNNSRSLLRAGCSWNGPKSSLPEFTPEDCWGLRRGQEHISGEGHVEVACPHILRKDGITHWCMPLVARGETVGLLYLEGADFANAGRRSGQHHVVYMLRETVALGLVNLRLREKLRSQSVRDPLTGLYNRRYLDESFDLELARASRSQNPVSVIMMDIDHFKKFNDTFGHDAGDTVLKSIANVLARWTRKGDIAGRFGGEEFLLLLPGADIEQAVARAESMRQAISGLDVVHGGQKLGRVSASFGVAVYPSDGDTCESLLQEADKSLYAAKTAGRDRVVASA